MLQIFSWPVEGDQPRQPARRSGERRHRYEALLARSYEGMRARRRQPA